VSVAKPSVRSGPVASGWDALISISGYYAIAEPAGPDSRCRFVRFEAGCGCVRTESRHIMLLLIADKHVRLPCDMTASARRPPGAGRHADAARINGRSIYDPHSRPAEGRMSLRSAVRPAKSSSDRLAPVATGPEADVRNGGCAAPCARAFWRSTKEAMGS
jgi:hypothetical protein